MLQTDDKRQTDGRPMTYSEHELEFTFAKNYIINFVLAKIACSQSTNNSSVKNHLNTFGGCGGEVIIIIIIGWHVLGRT